MSTARRTAFSHHVMSQQIPRTVFAAASTLVPDRLASEDCHRIDAGPMVSREMCEAIETPCERLRLLEDPAQEASMSAPCETRYSIDGCPQCLYSGMVSIDKDNVS